MTRVMITDRNANGSLAVHSPDYHAEVTAEKLIVAGEQASAEQLNASRALRKKVEAILVAHHQGAHDAEQAALAQHGAARYAHPLEADVDQAVLNEIVAAARGTILEAHFARADVQAAILAELHHETRSQIAVHRAVHQANAARA
jgi:hypothetical protein